MKVNDELQIVKVFMAETCIYLHRDVKAKKPAVDAREHKFKDWRLDS